MKQKTWIIVTLGLLTLGLSSGLYQYTHPKAIVNTSVQKTNSNEPAYSSHSNEVSLMVHVAGAVKNPGLYRIKPGSRAIDAIQMAGGSLAQANLDKVNLAAILKDGQRVFIPELKTNKVASSKVTEQVSNQAETLININTASAKELSTLPGVGERTAQAIIEYRNAHAFQSKEELLNIPRIGHKLYSKINDRIRL